MWQSSISFEEVFHGKLFKDNQISKIFVLWKDLEEKDFVFEDHEVSEVIWMEFEKCYQAVKIIQSIIVFIWKSWI